VLNGWTRTAGGPRAGLPIPSGVIGIAPHTVGEPAPEKDWLRAHARSVRELAYPTAGVLYFSGVGGPVQESHDAATRH
jgi:hypothetical protein